MYASAVVLSGYGLNCEEETAFALRQLGKSVAIVPIALLVKNPDILLRCRLLVIPGGFSYGDGIAAGAALALMLRFQLIEVLSDFLKRGNHILGICNGCQILVKLGFFTSDVTIAMNQSRRYEARWIFVTATEKNSFFKKGQVFHLPVAHKEGCFLVRGDQLSPEVEVLRYCSASGESVSQSYPENPNGSFGDIAGLISGNVVGIMPHPERAFLARQVPEHAISDTRTQDGKGDGYLFLERIVRRLFDGEQN